MTAAQAPVGRRQGLLLGVATVVFLGGVVALFATPTPGWHAALAILPNTLLLATGAAIVLRSDEARRIGWLLVVPGAIFNYGYAADSVRLVSDARWPALVSGLASVGVLAILLLILVFPTGRFPNRTAKWLAATAAVLIGALVLGDLAWFVGLYGGDYMAVIETGSALLGLVGLAGLILQGAVYTRRPHVERQQIKWFLLAIAGIGLYPLVLLLDAPDVVFRTADALSTSLWPITIFIAITRHRLYDIDRLISRTVAYVLVLASLAIVFVGLVTLVTTVLPAQDQLAVAATTLAVVALFNPLQRRVVDAVDRRFNRTRYVAQQVIEQFGRTVQDETDLRRVEDRLDDVLARTIAPRTVAVWQPVPHPSRIGS